MERPRWAWEAFLDTVLPGVYAWAITVGWSSFDRAVPFWVMGTGYLALLALMAAAGLRDRNAVAADLTMAFGFVGGSVAVWTALAVLGLTPPVVGVRGWLGVIGWICFAFGWGRTRNGRAPSGPMLGSHAELVPRGPARQAATLVWVVGVLSAAALLMAPWDIEPKERAVLAQVTALCGALWLLTATARLAAHFSFPDRKARLRAPLLGRLVVLGCLFGVGFWASSMD